jgi:TonB-like protein
MGKRRRAASTSRSRNASSFLRLTYRWLDSATPISSQIRRWLTRKCALSQCTSSRRSTSSTRFVRSPLSACPCPGSDPPPASSSADFHPPTAAAAAPPPASQPRSTTSYGTCSWEILGAQQKRAYTEHLGSINRPRRRKMKPRRINKISEMKRLVFIALACGVPLFSAASYGNHAAESAKCATIGLKELSAKEMKSRLRHTRPFDPPCCAETLNLKGTVVLDVSVSEDGNANCVEQISGHPLILTSAVHSVSGWKFEPYLADGQRKPFHGKLAIKFHATERVVTFKVVDEVSVGGWPRR